MFGFTIFPQTVLALELFFLLSQECTPRPRDTGWRSRLRGPDRRQGFPRPRYFIPALVEGSVGQRSRVVVVVPRPGHCTALLVLYMTPQNRRENYNYSFQKWRLGPLSIMQNPQHWSMRCSLIRCHF